MNQIKKVTEQKSNDFNKKVWAIGTAIEKIEEGYASRIWDFDLTRKYMKKT
jgi:hypothetical protein